MPTADHPPVPRRTEAVWPAFVLLAWLMTGCATRAPVIDRHPFRSPRDTLAFTNQTVWEYRVNSTTGRQEHFTRPEPLSYSRHCFVMSRLVKEFFLHARFDPETPAVDDATYRRRIRQVVRRGPRRESTGVSRVIFPGFADLWTFSAAHPDLLRSEAGGAWRSYFQRGHWRMVLPFSRRQRATEATRLADRLLAGKIAVVHVVTFPRLSVNHGILAYAVTPNPEGWTFTAYDPNSPGEPITLKFERAVGKFRMQPTTYFIGGMVEAYEVYRPGPY